MKFEDKVKILREKKHKGRETAEFLNDVVKMAEGEAFEYLMSEVDFCGAKIDLTLRPMIPRPETEYWVQCVIEEEKSKASDTHQNVLDVFCGSGCVGVAYMRAFPEASCVFVDVDVVTFAQVMNTVAKNGLDVDKVEVQTIDVGEFFAQQGVRKKFTHIFAVPPYVPISMKEEVMQELHSERELFFFDKEDGYFYIKQLLENVKHILVPQGVLYMEFDMTQRERIEEMLTLYGYTTPVYYKDPYGHEIAVKITIA